MRLYIASDSDHKQRDEWFVGTSRGNPDRIKDELGLNRKKSFVDVIIESPQARDILNAFKEKLGCSWFDPHKEVLLVCGQHCDLAQLLIEISKDYETKHLSIRRVVSRWLTGVESWEKPP